MNCEVIYHILLFFIIVVDSDCASSQLSSFGQSDCASSQLSSFGQSKNLGEIDCCVFMLWWDSNHSHLPSTVLLMYWIECFTDKLSCTACYRQINPNHVDALKQHPVLKVLICKVSHCGQECMTKERAKAKSLRVNLTHTF